MSEPDVERCRRAARHMLQHPMTCAELQPDMFALVRKHEDQLDRWFTQRLGYRLHVTSTTARLFKSTVVPHRRPLRAVTGSRRPLSQREYTMLALVLAAVAAGPRVISLHDLILDVRKAAADANVAITEDSVDRRALITALKWMIEHGMAKELHEQLERYASDASADAVIEIDPDRVVLLPLPALARSETPEQLLDRTDRRAQSRQWMRAWLVENPVLYRDDVTEGEWSELRRRFGEEDVWLDEMFGLVIEARAEGVAAIDPEGRLTDRIFPATATVGHAALLLLDNLARAATPERFEVVVATVTALAATHRKIWSQDLIDNPTKLTNLILDLLVDMRLVRLDRLDRFDRSDSGRVETEGVVGPTGDEPGSFVQLLPAAARYAVEILDDDAAPVPPARRRQRAAAAKSADTRQESLF
jgi:uncharacterized protein (TIGR02678 family)